MDRRNRTSRCATRVARALLTRGGGLLLAALLLEGMAPRSASALRVLVTNDDGIGAEGIAVLVERLAANPELEITVVAPAQNQSGTSDRFSDTPITVTESATARGYPGTAVAGFPSDTVLFAVLQLGLAPELVVSGINAGQNVAELTLISGTVGAARTAARFDIPAIAVSQGLAAAIDYDDAAAETASIVELFRTSPSFRRLLGGASGAPSARILNLNFPTCEQGTLRGLRVVGLGQTRRVIGYEPGPEPGVFVPEITTQGIGSTDCRSTLDDPVTDLDAMNNGFAAATPLAPDLEDEAVLDAFTRFLEPAAAGPGRTVLSRRGGPSASGPVVIGRGVPRLPSRP